MRAITSAGRKWATASFCDSSASSFTSTGPMFMMPNDISDASMSQPSAVLISRTADSGPPRGSAAAR